MVVVVSDGHDEHHFAFGQGHIEFLLVPSTVPARKIQPEVPDVNQGPDTSPEGGVDAAKPPSQVAMPVPKDADWSLIINHHLRLSVPTPRT